MNSTLLKPNAKLQYSLRISHGTYWDEFDQQSNQIFIDFAIISFILVTLMFDSRVMY